MRLVLCALAALAPAGCGGAVGRPVGKVTLKGEAVAGADVSAVAAAKPDAPATGRTGADGSYRLDYGAAAGLPVGRVTFTVTRYTLKNGRPLPDGEAGATLRADESNTTRQVYTLERDVPAGEGTVNLELSDAK